MKDPRLIELRLRAERDLSLSDGAFRLLCRLVSEKYTSPFFFAEEEFTVAWTHVQRLTGAAEDQSYRYIQALLAGLYLRRGALKGCPPQRLFSFVLNSRKKAGIESGEKAGNESREKAGHHISYPFRERIKKKKETIRARQGRGETTGKEEIERRPTPDEGNEARVRALAAAMREAAS